HGEGLDGVLRERRDTFTGILNGIDTQRWNPAHDAALLHPFSADDIHGKALEKERLRRDLGLADGADAALCVFVGRLVAQKGVDVLLAALPALLERRLCVAVLGSGD